MLDMVLLLGPRLAGTLEILRAEGLDVLILLGDLTERDEAIVRAEFDLVLAGCRDLEAEEGLEACRLWELLALDLLLLLDLSAPNAGPIISIRAKKTAARAFLTFFWYFPVAIICLLSAHNVITAIFETFCLLIKGTNPVSGNRNSDVFYTYFRIITNAFTFFYWSYTGVEAPLAPTIDRKYDIIGRFNPGTPGETFR